MSKNIFQDLLPFKTDRLSLDARIRRLIRDLNTAFSAYFLPNFDKRGGVRVETADGLNSLGTQTTTDFGVHASQVLSLMGGQSVHLKTNNSDENRFIASAPARQMFFSPSDSAPYFRSSTNNPPVAGDEITWGTPQPLLPLVTTNANGTSIRFGNGIQICTHITPANSSDETWTYPQPFIAKPVVTATIDAVGGNLVFLCFVFQATSTSATVSKRYWGGGNWNPAVSEPAHLTAIGRWI